MRENTQVLYLEPVGKTLLKRDGEELFRTENNLRNDDIEYGISVRNVVYKGLSTENMFKEYKNILETFGYEESKRLKNHAVFIVISASNDFFERNGWVRGAEPSQVIRDYMDDCYKFLLRHMGRNGTDENILGAAAHYDEKSPHFQAYFIPVVDEKKVIDRVKVDGKSEYAKDENGKYKFTERKLTSPAINYGALITNITGEFGIDNIGIIHDMFYEEVGKKYGLYRGEVHSTKKHITKLGLEYIDLMEKIINASKEFEKTMDKVYYVTADEKRTRETISSRKKKISELDELIESKKNEYEMINNTMWKELYFVGSKDDADNELIQDNDRLYRSLQETLDDNSKEIMETKNLLLKKYINKNREMAEEIESLKESMNLYMKNSKILDDLRTHYPVVEAYLQQISRKKERDNQRWKNG